MSYEEILEEIENLSQEETLEISKRIDKKIYSGTYPILENEYLEAKKESSEGNLKTETLSHFFDRIDNED